MTTALKTTGWQESNYDGFGIIDERGFSIIEIQQTAILEDYPTKTGHKHWSGHEGETYIEIPDEECESLRRLVMASPKLLAALERLLTEADDDGITQAGVEQALEAITDARGELPSRWR